MSIDLNFRMAKQIDADEILRTIAKESLHFLLENVDYDKIKCILITGSIVNGEGTVLANKDFLVTSDFDFVVYTDFSYYLKNKNLFTYLSKIISINLVKRNINTHVVFLLSPLLLCNKRLTNSNIYTYEFAVSSKCVFGQRLPFKSFVYPTQNDALELVFTVISELVFSNYKNFSKLEESYVYAKRSLTLLNSLLIFNRLYAESYEKRILLAEKYASVNSFTITDKELKILRLFTEYKLSGNYGQLIASLSLKNLSELIIFQKTFLLYIIKKILYFELSIILNKNNKRNHFEQTKLSDLLIKYCSYSKIKLSSKIVGLSIFFLSSFTKNNKRKSIFATFLFHKKPPKLLLNVVITLILLSGNGLSAKKILNYLFPWVNISGHANSLQILFELWKNAERSIKL